MIFTPTVIQNTILALAVTVADSGPHLIQTGHVELITEHKKLIVENKIR